MALIEDRLKLLSNLDETPDLLFDLEKDPGETENLAGRQPDEVKRLRSALGRWRQSCAQSRSGLPGSPQP